MLFKKVVFLGLFLSCFHQSYAYQITDEENGRVQSQTENNKEQIFCKYNTGDWYGSSKYDEQSDTIIIKNCAWGAGYSCRTYKIPKLAEIDGIKIYYSEAHQQNIFINDNGNWKWENAGCDF